MFCRFLADHGNTTIAIGYQNAKGHCTEMFFEICQPFIIILKRFLVHDVPKSLHCFTLLNTPVQKEWDFFCGGKIWCLFLEYRLEILCVA